MNILLLGKDGQVGRELQRTLLPLGRLTALGRKGADLGDLTRLENILQTRHPGIIVNAAAYTAVDQAEADADTAYRINAEAVQVLADYAWRSGALLVHYSTDYVFDGLKAAPYLETDETRPQNVYGRSKLAGEAAILESRCAALVLRTSWVFSAQGNNFIKTVLRLARERDSLRIVDDQRGAPTSAELLADVSALAIAAWRRELIAGGLYHLTASGSTSWYGLARHVLQRAQDNGARLRTGPDGLHPISTAEYPLPAPRPKNSCLDTGKLSAALGLELPDWTAHANRAVDQLTAGGADHGR
ncbi:dTDP-4-dehydrorhamnose reductase [Candidimonas nitroreducens]|uniref:dTDP-4-dehydrorhamnose reductase n=1 Tax=Candidimonas nitroreducens TaxID=683354 RepID=A0A225MVM2_9BURK|nr:dTDP-4-dehydrorhamnose reductase [Candidimonas nitroreducens]OWT63870.1 dTDP-4-dehydrorhamnose reductase [Candidimonas nitroreducens]